MHCPYITKARHDVMHCPYIKGLDSMDCRFLLVVTSPWESALFVVITVNRPLSYLGTFSRRLYILTCKYRYTIHEYWSSLHWCHIQEENHCTRQCLEQQTYWLMKNYWRALTKALTCDASSTHSFATRVFFPLKILFFSPCLISLNLPVAVAS